MTVREASIVDAERIVPLTLRAYSEYAALLGPTEWPKMKDGCSRVAVLMEKLRFFVAEDAGDGRRILGSIGYAAPNCVETPLFPKEWAHVRLLAVDPDYRGWGIGRALTKYTIELAQADGARVIGLHTSILMGSARHLYRSLGFIEDGMTFESFGVRYDRFTLALSEKA
jgi:ribosomal protein S18 acetylase RimI-like enzyme